MLKCHTSCDLHSRLKLSRMGLDSEIFKKLGIGILAGFFQATPHDAKVAPGIYAYLAAVRLLRDLLVPLGWTAESINNVELVKNPKNNFYITPSSGDENTGIKDNIPRTRNPKGPEIFGHVKNNFRQLCLFPEIAFTSSISRQGQVVWCYLYYIDTALEEIRSELSLPIGIAEDGHIRDWKERIILPSIKFENEIDIDLEQEDIAEIKQIDISIKNGRGI